MRGERGQASVELLGVVPLVVAVGLATAQLLAVAAAHEQAGAAAVAGAIALGRGEEASRAARRVVGPGFATRGTVVVRGRVVRVRLRPASVVPGAAGLLTAEVEADAGPG